MREGREGQTRTGRERVERENSCARAGAGGADWPPRGIQPPGRVMLAALMQGWPWS